jgi:hypothetical protein
MEYERTPDGQIQAAFASRAGLLLRQYQTLTRALPPEDRFEGTLAIAILQSLLTICAELLRDLQIHGRRRTGVQEAKSWGAVKLGESDDFPVSPKCVVECWKEASELTRGELVEGLRNALAHPGVQGKTPYAKTGFTTTQSSAGNIAGYILTNSPWVNESGTDVLRKFYPKFDYEQGRERLERIVDEWVEEKGAQGLSVEPDRVGSWAVFQNGRPFIPTLRIRLSVEETSALAHELSQLLASSSVGVGAR